MKIQSLPPSPSGHPKRSGKPDPSQGPTDRFERGEVYEPISLSRMLVRTTVSAALPAAVGYGAGTLLSSLPAVANAVHPMAGYGAAVFLAVGAAGSVSVAGVAGPAALLGTAALAGAGIACFLHPGAVGEVLTRPETLAILGGIVGGLTGGFAASARPQAEAN